MQRATQMRAVPARSRPEPLLPLHASLWARAPLLLPPLGPRPSPRQLPPLLLRAACCQLKSKLLERGHELHDVRDALDRLAKVGLQSDEEFAGGPAPGAGPPAALLAGLQRCLGALQPKCASAQRRRLGGSTPSAVAACGLASLGPNLRRSPTLVPRTCTLAPLLSGCFPTPQHCPFRVVCLVFAEVFARSKWRQSKWGPRRIEMVRGLRPPLWPAKGSAPTGGGTAARFCSIPTRTALGTHAPLAHLTPNNGNPTAAASAPR